MLNKEDILALAREYSEGTGKRYTFTEESLFEFLNELKKDQATSQDEQQPIGRVFTDEERFRSDGKSGPVWWFGPPPAGAMLYAAPIAQPCPPKVAQETNKI